MHKFIRVKKDYIRIGNPAKTNVIFNFTNNFICFNFSGNWMIKLFGCNTKYFWFNQETY